MHGYFQSLKNSREEKGTSGSMLQEKVTRLVEWLSLNPDELSQVLSHPLQQNLL